MNLGERKKTILRAIIDDYIQTGEPVGSRTIAKKYEMGVSSATIRNEMSDLEELGFLEQPHASAGRVPSDRGYRLYVDELMEIEYPTNEEIYAIKRIMQLETINEIEKIIERTTKLLSQVTKYTSAILSPSVTKSSVKSVQIMPVTLNDVIGIIVTDTGIVKHLLIKVPRPISSDTALRINNMLNDKLKGLTVEEIDLSVISTIQEEMYGYTEIFNAIIPALYESLKSEDCEVYLDGATNIFHYPEYNDIVKARDFISLIEKKNVMKDIFLEGDDTLIISIGKENFNDEVKNYSIVKTPYQIGGKTVGKIGVIGPTRMEYSRVIGVLKCFVNIINEILKDSEK